MQKHHSYDPDAIHKSKISVAKCILRAISANQAVQAIPNL